MLLRAVAPLSILYCCLRVAVPVPNGAEPWIYGVDAFAGLEAAFYLLIYLPRKYSLNRPTKPYNPLSTRKQREEAFWRCWDSIHDARAYVSMWFYGAPIESLGREDIKDLLTWRLWNETTRHPEHEAELDKYFGYTEKVLCTAFPKKKSRVKSMMVTFEPLNMKHRPLLWYAVIIAIVDLQCWLTMHWRGFTHFRVSPVRQLFGTLPWRPWTLLSRNRSPSSRITYWHHPHTSTTQQPIVFIHGIGVGLHFYLPFFQQLLASNPQIGILAIELLHVCSRITVSPPTPSQTASDIFAVLTKHNIESCVLLTHSYGSAIAAHMLRDPQASKISHLVFVDPVSFTFHDPTIAYNFLRRPPTTASEIQLEYFASTDPDVARTLTRGFNWSENSLWRDEVEHRKLGEKRLKTTVMIGGRDIITDTVMLGRYLTRREDPRVKWYEAEEATEDDDAWKLREWRGNKTLEVVWCPDLNHAEVFDTPRYLDVLVHILGVYCTCDLNSGGS